MNMMLELYESMLFIRRIIVGRSKTPTRTSCGADRFIPNRSCTDFESAQHRVGSQTGPPSDSSISRSEAGRGVDGYNREEYERVMSSNLNGDQPSSKILAFRQKAPSAPEGLWHGISQSCSLVYDVLFPHFKQIYGSLCVSFTEPSLVIELFS